jgi:hypothetical protein
MSCLRGVVVSAVLVLVAVPAMAKDVCFVDTHGNMFVIQKVKNVNKPGKTFPIIGYVFLVGNAPYLSPISGTAVGQEDGRVILGVRVHGMTGDTDKGVSALWTPGAGASTHFDTDGDGTANESDAWEQIECDDP